MSIQESSIVANILYAERNLNKVCHKLAKITQQIMLLQAIRAILPEEAFQHQIEAINQVIQAGKIDKSVNNLEDYNKIIANFKLQFSNLKGQLGEKYIVINKHLSQLLLSKTEMNHNLQQIESRLKHWSSKVPERIYNLIEEGEIEYPEQAAAPPVSSNKRKREKEKEKEKEVEETIREENSYTPPLKKVHSEKGKEKECENQIEEPPSEMAVLEIKSRELLTRAFQKPIKKMILGASEVVMISEPVRGTNSILIYDIQTNKCERLHFDSSQEESVVHDLAVTVGYAAAIRGTVVQIYGKSPKENIRLDDTRSVIGVLNYEYDDVFLSQPQKLGIYGDILAVGFHDGSLLVIDLPKFEELALQAAELEKTNLKSEVERWKKENFKYAVYSYDTTCVTYNGQKRFSSQTADALNMHVNALALDGHNVAVGMSNKATVVVNCEHKTVSCFREHSHGVTAVALSKNGTQLYSAAKKGRINVWQIPQWQHAEQDWVPGKFLRGFNLSGEIIQIETEASGFFVLTTHGLYHFDDHFKEGSFLQVEAVAEKLVLQTYKVGLPGKDKAGSVTVFGLSTVKPCATIKAITLREETEDHCLLYMATAKEKQYALHATYFQRKKENASESLPIQNTEG